MSRTFRTRGKGSTRKVYSISQGGRSLPGSKPGKTSFVSDRKSTSAGLPMLKPDEAPVPLRSPPLAAFPYEGGKFGVRGKIVGQMPPHETYVEPFAGAASVLIAKPPVKREVLADKDPRVMNVHGGLKARAGKWNMTPSRRRWESIRHKSPSSRSAED